MIPITQALLTNHNRPKFKLEKLKGIVIHWTVTQMHWLRNYFNTTKKLMFSIIL